MSRSAFDEGLVALLPRLRRFAHGLTRDAAEGDDLTQETIERALKSREQWQAGTRLDSWTYRIMRNIWIDRGRAATRRRQTLVAEEAGVHVADHADRGIEARVELGNVDRALAKLPDEQREAVVLVLVEGLAYKDAAEVIGCPIGTLTSRLGRGRTALLAELGEAA